MSTVFHTKFHSTPHLQEGLLYDLRVTEQKHAFFARHTRLHVELLEILVELCLAVSLGDFDGEHLEPFEEGGKARERLAAAASDTDEQRVAALRADECRLVPIHSTFLY